MVRISEYSTGRIAAAIARRIADLPDMMWWNLSGAAKQNRAALRTFKDTHKGETCVIMCNGPSLNHIDMTLIRDLPTIGMNRSYLMFERWGFMPTYFTAAAQHVVNQFSEDLSKLPMPTFINASHRHLYAGAKNCHFIRVPPRAGEHFSDDFSACTYGGATITFIALQMAYYFGFNRAIIVGMDHRFSAKGTPTITEVRKDEVDKDHVHPNYFPKGTKWELPDLYRSELAYALARQAYEADGRSIIDATVDGACTIFPKMSLAKALAL